MVVDGGIISTSAITSSFTAILRISQAVYELKAVGEQTRDLLDTTKYVNSSLESVRGLRRQKSDLLNRDEKRWIDQQVDFTQKAVDGVAVLIERARVDMAAKSGTGNEDEFETKHIKIHHRARFVLEDGPKVQTNLMKVTMAMNGLNSAMVTLSSREGHDVHLGVPKGGNAPGRRTTSPGNAPPPYAEKDFLNRRRTVANTVAGRQRQPMQQNVAFTVPADGGMSPTFGSQTVPSQPLHPRASMSSITPSIHFTSSFGELYEEHAIADDPTSPACMPVSSIHSNIGSEAYLIPVEMDASAHPPLHSHHSEPAVSRQDPPVPRKPQAYQTHHPNLSSISSMNEEFEQTLMNNPWGASTPRASHSPARDPIEAQKPLPMLPLHPTPSMQSLHSAFSDTSNDNGMRGPPPVSRGRSWLLDRANSAASGNTTPLSRSQSNNVPYPNNATYPNSVPYPHYNLDRTPGTPSGWPG